jgi:hypothetical protein
LSEAGFTGLKDYQDSCLNYDFIDFLMGYDFLVFTKLLIPSFQIPAFIPSLNHGLDFSIAIL